MTFVDLGSIKALKERFVFQWRKFVTGFMIV